MTSLSQGRPLTAPSRIKRETLPIQLPPCQLLVSHPVSCQSVHMLQRRTDSRGRSDMECPRCEQVVYLEGPELSTNTTQILPGIEGIHCPTCALCIGLSYAQEWIPIKQCLLDPSQPDGWSLAVGLWDKAIHWTLSQVVYRTLEPPNPDSKEAVFDTPDPTDVIYLLWIGGQAVGFSTLKPRGATIEKTRENYAMVTVDTIFVRSSYRRRGHVTSLLQALSESHDDIGFSQPISDTMVKVLWKFLNDNKNNRRRFWEISGAGNEGCRKLLWYMLRHKCRSLSYKNSVLR